MNTNICIPSIPIIQLILIIIITLIIIIISIILSIPMPRIMPTSPSSRDFVLQGS